MRISRPLLAIVAAAVGGCESRSTPGFSCGLATMTGPLVVLEAFGRGNALAAPPGTVPPSLPVRVVGGPVLRGIVGTVADSGWVVGAEGVVPDAPVPGYGVLVVHQGAAEGVLVFEGQPVTGATRIGSVAVGDTIVPLLGLRIDPRAIGDSTCPVFPDSAR